jgi:hypothetical protein
MSLKPYPNVAMRRYKVWKHVFDQQERWWEVYGSFAAWGADWNRVRGAGCDRSEQGGERAKIDPVAAPVLDAHHEAWLAEASRAFEYAKATNRVLPTDRASVHCYLGEAGVKVVAVAHPAILVTCFRSAVIGARIPAGSSAYMKNRARAEATAVRRAIRRASLGVERS